MAGLLSIYQAPTYTLAADTAIAIGGKTGLGTVEISRRQLEFLDRQIVPGQRLQPGYGNTGGDSINGQPVDQGELSMQWLIRANLNNNQINELDLIQQAVQLDVNQFINAPDFLLEIYHRLWGVPNAEVATSRALATGGVYYPDTFKTGYTHYAAKFFGRFSADTNFGAFSSRDSGWGGPDCLQTSRVEMTILEGPPMLAS